MLHSLDDSATVKRLDSLGMLRVETQLPESCRDALNSAPVITLPHKQIKDLTILGMGGSAIGGSLLKDWLTPTCPVPIVVSKHYEIPAYIGEDSLVYAVSYSGGTEETLSALDYALKKRAKVVVFGTGGEIRGVAERNRLPFVPLPPGFQPRAALPYQLFSMVAVTRQLGLADAAWGEVEEALRVVEALRSEVSFEVPFARNPAKLCAAALQGYVPLVYGSSLHESVAYRAGTQLNENSKSPAGSGYFPEVFHNAIMAGEGDEGLLKSVRVLLLLDPAEPPSRAAKIQRFRRIIEPSMGPVQEFTARGTGRLARILSALYFIDYVSLYLAFLYGKDPGRVDSIAELKRG